MEEKADNRAQGQDISQRSRAHQRGRLVVGIREKSQVGDDVADQDNHTDKC
jgi:hypothetical protein